MKRGSYATISEELDTKVAKCAAENGVSASLRRTKAGFEEKHCPWLGHYVPEKIGFPS